MNVFVTDSLISIDSIYSKHAHMISEMKKCHSSTVVIFFVNPIELEKDDTIITNVDLIEYTKKYPMYYVRFQKYLSSLLQYSMRLCTKEHAIMEIERMLINTVHFYCKKENILDKLDCYGRKLLFINDYDNINPKDYIRYMCNGFHNGHQEKNADNYRHIPYTIPPNMFPSFQPDRSKAIVKISKDLNKHNNILFIQILDVYMDFINILDRVLLGLKGLDVHLILYYPYKEVISDDIFINNNDVFYKEIGELTLKYVKSSTIINTYMKTEDICEYIYLSDIYIPISFDFSILSLVAQQYKTYCLFLNDNYTSVEYCIYGDNPIMKSEDIYYNIARKRVQRVLKVSHVAESIKKYIENKKDPFFTYKKEIAELLFA